MSVVNLEEKFALLPEYWQPRVVAELNDYQFKVARVEGEFVWPGSVPNPPTPNTVRGVRTGLPSLTCRSLSAFARSEQPSSRRLRSERLRQRRASIVRSTGRPSNAERSPLTCRLPPSLYLPLAFHSCFATTFPRAANDRNVRGEQPVRAPKRQGWGQ